MSESGPQDPYSRPAGEATPPLADESAPAAPNQPAYSQPTTPPPAYQQLGAQPGYQQPYSGAPAYPVDSYGYRGGAGYTAPRPNNSMALVAMISGIAGLTVIPFIGSIVAVITGIMARRQIAETGEEGSGMATAGLIMGWIGVGLAILLIVGMILFWGVFVAAMGSSSYS